MSAEEKFIRSKRLLLEIAKIGKMNTLFLYCRKFSHLNIILTHRVV